MDVSVKESMKDIVASFEELPNSDQNIILKKIIRRCKRRQLQFIFNESRRLLAIDFVAFLPKELIEKVFSYLDATELSRAAGCSRQWRDHTNNSKLWKALCRRRNCLRFGEEKGCRDLYLQSSSAAPPQSPLTTPTFHFVPHLCETIPPLCRWKDVYIRASHLNRNWETGRYTVYPPLRGHKERITCLHCSGRYLASGSDDRQAIIWDLQSHQALHVLNHPDSVLCLAMKMNLLVTGCGDGVARLFNVSTGKCLGELKGHSGSVNCLAFDGNKIVSGAQDKSIIIWSASSGRRLYKLEGHIDEIASIKFHGSFAVSTSWDETAQMWNVDAGTCTQVLLGHTEVVHCCEFNEEYIVTGGGDKLVKIWLVEDGDCLFTLQGHTDDVYCVSFNDDVIVSGSADSTVRVWSWFGGIMHVMREHIGVVRCLSLSDNRLITAGDQKKVIVWDPLKGKLLNVIHRNPSLVHLMSVSDTRLIVATPEGPGSVTVMSYW